MVGLGVGHPLGAGQAGWAQCHCRGGARVRQDCRAVWEASVPNAACPGLLPCQGLEPVDILLVKRDGRFSGEAFVVLGSPLQIQSAVDKNKSYMGRRYVEVFRAKKLVRCCVCCEGRV